MKQSHKTLLLWVLLILMFVAIWNLVKGEEQPRIVAFSQFLEHVRAQQVERVEIQPMEHSAQYEYVLDSDRGPERKLTVGPISDRVDQLLEDHDVQATYLPEDQNSLWTSLLVTWLPMIFLLVIFFFFMRQLQASGGKAMSFGKSRARLLNESQNKVTFADVAGIDEAKDDCEEIIEFLKDPKKFQRLGGRIPKGVLLMGAPGTGKTLLARAIAGEAGVPFFSISGSDFVEMFVGVGASRVRDLFEQGKKQAPCIIFIDEIDAVGRHRGSGLGGGHDEREQTLNQLLVEMDGFESTDGRDHHRRDQPAGRSRPGDSAARPIRPPDRGAPTRTSAVGTGILHGSHQKDVPLAPDVDLDDHRARHPGVFSGADLENLVNEGGATRGAAQDKDYISLQATLSSPRTRS